MAKRVNVQCSALHEARKSDIISQPFRPGFSIVFLFGVALMFACGALAQSSWSRPGEKTITQNTVPAPDTPRIDCLTCSDDQAIPPKSIIATAKKLRGEFVRHLPNQEDWKSRIDTLYFLAINRYEDQIVESLVSGTEEQKLARLKQIRREIAEALGTELSYASGDPEGSIFRNSAIYATMLSFQTKGRFVDVMAADSNSVRRQVTGRERGLVSELSSARARLANHLIRAVPENEAEGLSLAARVASIEDLFSNSITRSLVQTGPLTVERIKARLGEKEALVDFVLAPLPKGFKLARSERDPGKDVSGMDAYFAITMTSSATPPKVTFVGVATEVHLAISSLREALIDTRNFGAGQGSVRGLKETISWGFVRDLERNITRAFAHAIGCTQIFVSPEGMLNMLPFSALHNDRTGNYLVDDYEITYLTSPRDVLRSNIKVDGNAQPVVIGNPDYGHKMSAGAARGASAGSVVRRASDFSRVDFVPLPGTDVEAKAVAKLIGGKLVVGKMATETYIKGVMSPRILHIATHGFFMPDDAPRKTVHVDSNPFAESVIQSTVNVDPPKVAENPLLRSGLVFAGANHLSSGLDDGVLTALEATDLHLWGTDLVVLSACETGLGSVMNGEGVFGLRRSVWLAGASSIVMSLWAVDDAATSAFMIEFYNSLVRGATKGAALRSAQLQIRSNRKWADPYYWASFVLVGDRGVVSTYKRSVTGNSAAFFPRPAVQLTMPSSEH